MTLQYPSYLSLPLSSSPGLAFLSIMYGSSRMVVIKNCCDEILDSDGFLRLVTWKNNHIQSFSDWR